MKKKFLIWLSIWLSIPLVVHGSSHGTTQVKQDLDTQEISYRRNLRGYRTSRSYTRVHRTYTEKDAPIVPAAGPPNSSYDPGCIGHTMSKAQAHQCWDGLIAQYSWSNTKAFHVMFCESKGQSNAKNRRSSATGLMQILGGPTDPQQNMSLAFSMYRKRGWQPWVCT